MRINEIASAEEQIELWKLISNSVWQSLQQQQRADQQRKAVRQVRQKSKPIAKRGFHPLPPPPSRNTPKTHKPPTNSVASERPKIIPPTSATAPIYPVTGRPLTQPRTSANLESNPKFATPNRNQEFPSPAITPVKPGPSSRKA